MFSFWKKKAAPAGRASLDWLGADMHSHLIPGIDDGAPDIEASLALIRGLRALGYAKLYTTPHILWGMYDNTPDSILGGLEKVRQALKDEGMELEIGAAAEYFVDEHFASEVAAKKPLLTLPGNYILVEASTYAAPFDFKEVLFQLQLENYTPIIAHPERYIYLKKDPSYLDDLRYNGCSFQLNLMSLIGHYGALSKDLAEYLLRNDFYDFVGTDLHHAQHLPLLEKAAASPLLDKLRDSGRIQNTKL